MGRHKKAPMTDYYGVLSLNKSSSVADVTASFRKLALKHHPDRNPDDMTTAQRKLDEICEAYEVLSNPMHRAVYDQHGSRGLTQGVADGRGGMIKGTGKYKFGQNGDSQTIFMRVFGTDNPFAEIFQVSKDFFDPEYVEPTPVVLRKDVECTLEEFSVGAIKIVCVDIPGCGAFDVNVEVKRGWADGTELTMSAREIAAESCPKEHYTTSCIFTMRQAAHGLFERCGDDLVHTASLSLVQTLTGCALSITSLEGHELNVGVNEVVNETTKITLPGQGMPCITDPSVRGDLIVRFKPVYPKHLNDNQKHLIKSALFLPAEAKLNETQQDALRMMRKAFQFN